jgi:hypothetical protein
MFNIHQWYLENKEKVKAQHDIYRKSHLEKYREYTNNYRILHPDYIVNCKVNRQNMAKKIKSELYQLLGGKCVICGYVGTALCIDHVNGGGTKERKENGSSDYRYYRKILGKIKAGSKDYQLLCANHNLEKEMSRRYS